MRIQKQTQQINEDEQRILNKFRTMSLKNRKAWEQTGDDIIAYQVANTKPDDNVVFTDKWHNNNHQNEYEK